MRKPATARSNARCAPACCLQREDIRARPLLERKQAQRLTVLFKVLANDTRLRLLHVLVRGDEVSVNDMARSLRMTPQAVSNQLQKLAALGVLESRRDGNSMLYRVVDPCVTLLLDHGLCMLEESQCCNRKPLLI